MRSVRTAAMLIVVAVVLLAVGAWLSVDAPTAEVDAADELRSADGTVGCTMAPWDEAVNGPGQGPGGSDRSFEFTSEVAEKCHDASMTRVHLAEGSGALGLALLVTGSVVGVRSGTSSCRPTRVGATRL